MAYTLAEMAKQESHCITSAVIKELGLMQQLPWGWGPMKPPTRRQKFQRALERWWLHWQPRCHFGACRLHCGCDY